MTTQVTRIGTILVILFLVQMLISLYRYHTRLATFYRSELNSEVIVSVQPRLTLNTHG